MFESITWRVLPCDFQLLHLFNDYDLRISKRCNLWFDVDGCDELLNLGPFAYLALLDDKSMLSVISTNII